jgi:hypothetical protein
MSGSIKFPTEKLQLVTISKAGSIVQLWAAEPAFSNADGSVHFEGVIPNPGYQGGGGRIITLYFKVKTTGTALITFSSASALANDGLGTDILSSYNNAELTLVPPSEVKVPQKPPSVQPSTAPEIEITTEKASTTPIASTLTQKKVSWPDIWDLFFGSELSIFPFLLALFIALIIFFLYGWYMVRRIKREMRREVNKLDADIHRAFHLLRDDISEHLEMLEKARGDRPLTTEEQKFVSYFKHNINDTEKYLASDLKRVKDRVR